MGRLPVPAMRAQPCRVFKSWWNSHSGSSSSSRVCRVSAHGCRWSCSTRVRQQPSTMQPGLLQASAIFWAAVGPRPRWVTFSTSTPRVITSCSTDWPSRPAATGTGTGPTPLISQSWSPATRPRRNVSTSTRSNARNRGFVRDGRPGGTADAAAAGVAGSPPAARSTSATGRPPAEPVGPSPSALFCRLAAEPAAWSPAWSARLISASKA